MADTKHIDEGGVTTVAPKEADKTSSPVPNDAGPNDPPVRTNRPDVPIATHLAAGAGQHAPRVLDHEVNGVQVDADGHDREGRFVGVPKGSGK